MSKDNSAAREQAPEGAAQAEGEIKSQKARAAEAASQASLPGEPQEKDKSRLFEAARNKLRADALKEAEPTSGKSSGPEPAPEQPAELETAKLREENSELKNRILRTLAEMENLRRRTDREKSDASKFAIARFARDMLSIGDNLQRAIGTVPAEAVGEDPALQSFLEGVQLTERELLNVLERHGVRKIEAVGERFDPNLHQAMMEAENAEVPAGTVLQAFQPAYVIEDRVLRPAMVVVSKGGPKEQKKPANDPAPRPPGSDEAAKTDKDEPPSGNGPMS